MRTGRGCRPATYPSCWGRQSPRRRRRAIVDQVRTVVVVIGNPAIASRTGEAATLLGDRVASMISAEVDVIEVAEYASALISWGDPNVGALKRRLISADAAIVATPTYKASYTGLLKLFLDQFAAGELGGVPTIALMTGGSLAHSLAVQVHLVPVLSEIGASSPTPGVYLYGAQLEDPGPHVEEWFDSYRDTLARSLVADHRRPLEGSP